MPAPLPIRTDRDAGRAAPARPPRARRPGQRPPAGARQRARRPAPRGGGPARRDDRADARGLGPPLQRGGRGGPARPAPSRPALRLDEGQQAALKALVLRGPNLERDGCVAWRARDLCALVEARFGVRYGESGMLKLLKGLDLSWQKARPVHPEADPKAQERFKKPCPA